MFSLGLTKRQTEAFYATLKSSHRIKIIIHIHNSDEEQVNDFDYLFGLTHLLSGAVQVDTTQDISRSLSLTFLDPFRRFRWSPDHTSHGTLYSGDFISVKYAVHVQDDNLGLGGGTVVSPKTVLGMQSLGQRKRKSWVEIPVFWGPLTAYEANGAEITIEAQGKESLALDPHFMTQGLTLHKHHHVDDAVKEIMRRIGERRFAIPNLPFRIQEKRAIHPRAEPWKVISGGEQDSKGHPVAGLIHRTGKHPHHIFYDGEGRLKVRRLNKEPDFTFGPGTLETQPDLTYDDLSFINHVVVNGSKLQGKGKPAAKAEVSLPRHHPLSPWKLSRNGQPRYLTMYVDATNLKTDRECRQRAIHLLNHHSMIGLQASFDCLPIPMLEEGDVIRVKTDDIGHITFPLKQFTIPLTSDQGMTIGDNKRLRVGHRRKGPPQAGAAGPPGGTGGKDRKAAQSA